MNNIMLQKDIPWIKCANMLLTFVILGLVHLNLANVNVFPINEEEELETTVVPFQKLHLDDTVRESIFFKPESTYFSVKSGNIRVKTKFDLETACSKSNDCCNIGEEFCVIEDKLYYKDKGSIKSIPIAFNISDIDDKNPEFNQEKQILRISESAKPGHLITFKSAQDADYSDKYSNLVYNIVGEDLRSYFKLKPDNKLELFRKLDYENKKIITGKIEACNSGKCATMELTINIKDENDNIPKFKQGEFNKTINEDIPVDSVILTLKAEDADSKDHSKMYYSIQKDRKIPLVFKTFRLDETTGELKSMKKLDAKAVGSYTFTVLVGNSKDHATPTDRAKVNIIVKDTNDHSPQISILDKKAEISENTEYKNLVSFTVSDEDLGENSRVDCKLQSPEGDVALHRLSNDVYEVKPLKRFDAEKISRLVIRVNCWDHGEPRKQTTRKFLIPIRDIDEFQPVMTQMNYDKSVVENIQPGSIILNVTAKDKDRDSKMRYEIEGTGGQYFSIDPKMGVIRVKDVSVGDSTPKSGIDAEENEEIKFKVIATDEFKYDGEPKTTSALVRIKVIDENDNLPEILVEKDFTIMEGESSKTIVDGKLTVIDNDKDLSNRQVTCRFGGAWYNSARDYDKISVKKDCRLETKSKLDRESGELIIVNVLACDGGEAERHRCSSKNITVKILDANDNAPEWIHPPVGKSRNSEDITVLHLKTDLYAGSHVTYVKATDKDSDENGRVQYKLVDHGNIGPFVLNSTTGELLVNPDSNSQTPLVPSFLKLRLRAYDNGSNRKESDAFLAVNVTMSEDMLNAQLNYIIIIVMVVITALVSIALIIAICVVKRRPKSVSTSCRANGQTGINHMGANNADYYADYYTRGQYCNGQLIYSGGYDANGTLCKHEVPPNVVEVHGLKYAAYPSASASPMCATLDGSGDTGPFLAHGEDHIQYTAQGMEPVYAASGSIGGSSGQREPVRCPSGHRPFTPSSNPNSANGHEEVEFAAMKPMLLMEHPTHHAAPGANSNSNGCSTFGSTPRYKSGNDVPMQAMKLATVPQNALYRIQPPYANELDGDSADSGRGASEEDGGNAGAQLISLQAIDQQNVNLGGSLRGTYHLGNGRMLVTRPGHFKTVPENELICTTSEQNANMPNQCGNAINTDSSFTLPLPDYKQHHPTLEDSFQQHNIQEDRC